MFAEFGFDSLTAPQAAVFFGLVLGLAFGLLAERTAFCFRRALIGADRRSAAGVWAMALIAALLGTQGAVQAGWISFDDHRLHAPGLPWLAILTGGLLFGAGTVLARGCLSRLTVLSGGGNLRAALALLVVAVLAHATLKGVLAPLRTSLGAVTLELSSGTLPGSALLWTALLALGAGALVWRSGARPALLLQAALLGLLVPLGWVGTGLILYDDFDPVAFESLSFTLPSAEALFWTIASSAIPATFGVGLLGGTLAGAAGSAALSGRFQWQSFESPAQTGRTVFGAVLMGVGGVLAGGCTVGAGLSGVPTLSVAALLAITAIGAGVLATNAALSARPLGAPRAV